MVDSFYCETRDGADTMISDLLFPKVKLKDLGDGTYATAVSPYEVAYTYSHLTAGTHTVKNSTGILKRIIANSAIGATALVIKDNATTIASLTSLSVGVVLNFDCEFATSLVITVPATCSITVVYR